MNGHLAWILAVHFVTCLLKGRKAISGDSRGRSFWLLVHFWSILTFFQYSFGGNSAFGAVAPSCPPGGPRSRWTPSNMPGHLLTEHIERVERWRHFGAAAEFRSFRKQATIYNNISSKLLSSKRNHLIKKITFSVGLFQIQQIQNSLMIVDDPKVFNTWSKR